ncbi:hypothetical protein CCHL11_05992 [Colletotrichum chlorophyti]|uniref:Rhodopsin domain-containing protein n=1 Tax=Colletotrichum chlorophyti TaxID=708187 RepID=A0A1Q8RWK8_9PEZI|nr:hypothetical protein CCHL11_05992 [Colletotrichum chlorophyti]
MCCYATIVWTLKFNMLFFYRRLVEGQWVHKFILPVMCFVGVTALAMALIIVLTCRPITLMWQVRPDPGENCVPQNKVYFYSILAMNVTTDLCIIAIPIPVIPSELGKPSDVISLVRASIWRRLGVYFLFSLGVFVISASIIRVILIFHPTGQFGPGAMWSIREDFVAIFVGQAPMIVPMFKKRFWQQPRSRFTPKSSQGSEGHELRNGVANQNNKPKDPYSLTQMGFTHITNATQGTRTAITIVSKGSQERVAVAEQNVTEDHIKSSQGGPAGHALGDIEYLRVNITGHSLEITELTDAPEPVTEKPDNEKVKL